jgi:hypothetical protein
MQTLFLDSNILLEGMRSRWGLSKAALSLCAARIHQLVLLLSNNTEHFTATVARRTGLRIATPYQFFRAIHP